MQLDNRISKPARIFLNLLFIVVAINVIFQLFDLSPLLGGISTETVDGILKGAGLTVLCLWFFGGYIAESLHRYNNQ